MFKKSSKFLSIITIFLVLFLASNITTFAEISTSSGGNSITIDSSRYLYNDTITIHYNLIGQLKEGAWLGIIPADIEHGNEDLNSDANVGYAYLTGNTSGTLTLTAPELSGNFDIRVHDGTDATAKEIIASPIFKISSMPAVLKIDTNKDEFGVNEQIVANLTVDNITEIVAEDITVLYNSQKLNFLGFDEIDGIKLIESVQDDQNGKLRFILASKGEANIINSKKTLIQLNFESIQSGKAKIDIIKGRVTDGIEMEKDLSKEACDFKFVTILSVSDVNNSGEFTLLDLGIDARHLGKDPSLDELSKYNTDINVNNAIDDDDLLEIGRLMLENTNYQPNQY